MHTHTEDGLLYDLVYPTLPNFVFDETNVGRGDQAYVGSSRVVRIEPICGEIRSDLLCSLETVCAVHVKVHKDKLVHGLLVLDFRFDQLHCFLSILSQFTLDIVVLELCQ